MWRGFLFKVYAQKTVKKNTLKATLRFEKTSGNRDPLNTKKTAFYFTLKTLFVLKICKLFSHFFDQVGERPDQKAKVYFKTYDAINW